MTWTETEREALKAAYAYGTLRVSYDGRTVEYGAQADLIRCIRVIERGIAATAGKPRPSHSLASFRKS
jgi:hypothetical protein